MRKFFIPTDGIFLPPLTREDRGLLSRKELVPEL